MRQAFEGEGYEVFEAADKAGVISCLAANDISLVTLDLKLVGEDGLELAREIRALRNVPIVMMTARDVPFDHVRGLEHGADDHIAKPFHFPEAIVRVRNVLHRYSAAAAHAQLNASDPPPRQFRFDHCVLDTRKRELKASDGTNVELTEMEFRLLALFLKNPARVLCRDEIAHSLQGHDWSPLDRTIDVHVARLRRKIEPVADEPKLIKSVRGIGYVFTGDVSVPG